MINKKRTLMTMLDNFKSIICVCEEDTFHLLFANKAACDFLGKSDYEDIPCYKFVKNLDSQCPNCSRCRIDGDEVHIDEKYDEELQKYFQIDSFKVDWFGKKAFYNVLTDVTDNHELKKTSDEDNALIWAIAHTVYEFIAFLDVATNVITFRELNPESEVYSLSYGEIIATIDRRVISKEREKYLSGTNTDYIVQQLEHERTYSFSWTQPSSNGSNSRKQLTFFYLEESHSRLVALKSDITEAYEREKMQLHRIEIDHMTGLLHHESMRKKVNKFLRSETRIKSCGFLMLDIDKFKLVNDNYGHSEGDRVICCVADALKKYADNAFAARMGGDEFAIFFPNEISEKRILDKAQKLFEDICAVKIQNADKNITCSIGVVFGSDFERFDDMYIKADRALYYQKKHYNGCGCCSYDEL